MRRIPAARVLGGLLVALLLAQGTGAMPGWRRAHAAPPQTPPPTPVPPFGSPSPFVSRLATPSPGAEPPTISAPSAVLADLDTGQVLFEQGGRIRRPIASLTKIMTALLVLERARLSDQVVVSERAASPDGDLGQSELGLEPGERVRVGDLLYALLLQSANDAALALAEHVAGSVERFVRLMNARARRLGMRGTEFRSPSGLDDRGTSTALDLVRLTRAAYRDPRFARIVAERVHEIPSADGGVRRIQNRNVLLWLYPGAIGVKTGYTRAAGYCVVAAAERDGLRLVAVVLGASGEAFSDAAALLDHGFFAYDRRVLVRAGEPLGWAELVGGRVPVAAGATLEALVPTAPGSGPTSSVRIDPGAAFPPARGERVGAVVFRLPGMTLG
ncbi:MAG TPA: D-alanyl-D-alanine carboxypeptidase family protein, partial [Actinomycetota bacterium]|nr:D-alanyl-D-alanine carboxypeptidase family protein [Actinomycetota bacterium]